MVRETMSANISTSFRKKNDTPHLSIAVSVRLVSFVADNKVSRVASMAWRMWSLRLCRAAVSNLRIACVAVSNLGIWSPMSVSLQHIVSENCAT